MTDEPTAQEAPLRMTTAVPGYDASFQDLFAVAYRVAYRILGSREDAADVASEAMAKAWISWTKVATYAPAWVARVSANGAISGLRRRAVRERLASAAHAPASVTELRQDLVRALRRLPTRQREVLVLRYLADLPEHEVAAALGCTVGTVKQHAHRALRALRTDAQLDDEEI